MLFVVATFLLGFATTAHASKLYAQGVTVVAGDPLGRALQAEDEGRRADAIVAYKEVLQRALLPDSTDGDRIALAMMGLERLYSETGAVDSILPVVNRVLQLRPTDPIARSIQLRQLATTDRNSQAYEAFLEWRRAAPNSAAPFREYAQLLLSANRTGAADSVLRDAVRYIGGSAVAGEVAQLNVSLQRWQAAAVAYREALDAQPWLETSAMFSLARAPLVARDSIRDVLRAQPISLYPRRLLSSLELSWGEPRRAWFALSAVRADDSTAAAWRAFAERAELAESWVVARDVWTAVFDTLGDVNAQRRAATAAVAAGDAAGALEIIKRPASGTTKDEQARLLLAVHIEALGQLGKAEEAEKLLAHSRNIIDDAAKASLARPMVSAWLRAGNVDRAKQAAASADLSDDDEIVGWLALYEGDLVTARRRLVRAESKNMALNDALGLLARTRLATSKSLGAAFMELAQNDSMAAALSFAKLSDSIVDASPALLSIAARIAVSLDGKQPQKLAEGWWERITSDYPKSPEAAEALLSWARVLRSNGMTAEAMQRIERLLIDYPDSALLPQARRELDSLRGQVPPSGTYR